jgi:hypothetical protein
MKANNQNYMRSKGKLLLFLLFSVLIMVGGLIWVTIMYEKSLFPARLIEGQLNFSGETVKGYYKHLIQHGTLHIYIYTQIIDFIFIGGLLLTLFFVHKLLEQIQPTLFWKNMAKKLAVIAPLIASSDVIENIFSFLMLQQPTSFPEWFAIGQSSFSLIKWLWAFVGILLLTIQLFVAIYFRSKKYVKK